MMLRNKVTVFILGIALMILSACAMAVQPTATPTVDIAATQAFEAARTASAKATADRMATGVAKETLDAKNTAESEAKARTEAAAKTQTQEAANATSLAAAEQTKAADNTTATASARRTEVANKTATYVAVVTGMAARSTEEASGMFSQIQTLFDDGYIETTEGSYHELDDFNESWAQLGWYMWWPTRFSPNNFVVRADAAWESASDTANFDDSGCGFVFHAEDADNHIRVYLAMNGYVYMNRFKGGLWTALGSGYYERFDIPSDSAQIMLVAENGMYTFFVNGEKVHAREDATLYKGNLALTLASGTNKDWGTRCTMTNVELWVLP